MNCERFETMIDDYVDGTLAADENEEAQRHLGECAACRGAVCETRELLHRAADLPRSIDPARDLMPEIRRAIEPDEPAHATPALTGESGRSAPDSRGTEARLMRRLPNSTAMVMTATG